MKARLNRILYRLQQEMEANPLLVLTILAAVLTSAAKLISATSAAANSRTWRKEVNRRVAMQSKK